MRGRRSAKRCRAWLGFGLGGLVGYLLAQQAWAIRQIVGGSVERALRSQADPASAGCTSSSRACPATIETEAYVRSHTVVDGIERIVYLPRDRRFDTPIVMQHGMWHGAWCWELWQELFAEWGWETHAHSLPGHAGSPAQRPVARCTLDYYLGFLSAEVARLQPRPSAKDAIPMALHPSAKDAIPMALHPSAKDAIPMARRPVLLGHSMGGALVQWYLKHVADDLPAVVLVAPWVSHSLVKDGLFRLACYDPVGVLLMALSWDASPMKRRGKGSAVRFLVGPRAAVPLEELQPRLGPESALVLYQHNPPFWYPPEQVETPMLWVAGGEDPLLAERAERRSAAHYGADYVVTAGARHNVMMEQNYRETAEVIHRWLVERGIG